MAQTRPILLLWLLTALLATFVAVPAAPAAANHHTCDGLDNAFPWSSEAELAGYRGSEYYDCRRNFITDPGVGQLLDANSTDSTTGLLSPDRTAFYLSKGFTTDFLYWAERSTITTGENDTRHWSACKVGVEPGEICPQIKTGPMSDDWDVPSVTLSVIGDDDAFIALVCGNYRVPVTPPPSQYPTVEGVKFRDIDRDGDRSSGEAGLSGWTIRLRQLTADVGAVGPTVTKQTAGDGSYSFSLEGRTPGRYVVEELVQSGWRAYTAAAHVIDVPLGAGDTTYTRDFGNAQTTADVAKVDMEVHGPATFDVDTPTPVEVEVEVENRGPAVLVDVSDELVIDLPDDCVADDPRQTQTAALTVGTPQTLSFSYVVTCQRASEHPTRFDDTLSIVTQDVVDDQPGNNTMSKAWTPEVHAYTTLGADTVLACDDATDVVEPYACTVDLTVTNDGYAPMAATAAVQLDVAGDCTASPDVATVSFDDLVEIDDAQVGFTVTCTHRSFHDTEVSASVTADDPHVFDAAAAADGELVPATAVAGDGPSVTEVFHDATMGPTDLHLTCDEVLGATEHTCTAVVDYVKSGPAPLVNSVVEARLTVGEDCTTDTPVLTDDVVLGSGGRSTFTWDVTCEASDVLHPASVAADVAPEDDADSPRWEPHAVDDPSWMRDVWAVPYCLPTVNPHGKKQPQAPGSGMNEDGFYVFGMLSLEPGDEQVSIRDDGSGHVFGPFATGTRIKWVEGNGAKPSISAMGSNNGRGGGNGSAGGVDYRVKARGDAQAFFVDEAGVEVAVTCLVPNPPK